MNFQDIILSLERFWSDYGCIIQQPYDIEVGAGTFNPATFLRSIGPEPWNAAYVEPSRRPTDGRYGENPYRLGAYYQYQVVLKPAPDDVMQVYLDSLKDLGIDARKNDIRFVEDDWESPTLGASGLGWEVWWNGAEITQFTYFQQFGSLDLEPITAEITYGLERLAMYLQDVESFFEIDWNGRLKYGDVHHQSEVEFSKYHFELSDVQMLFTLFDMYEREAIACVEKGLVQPCLDYVLKCSHTFNMLDARGAISVTERVGYIARVRNLARRCAKEYVKQRKEMGYPLSRITNYELRVTNQHKRDTTHNTQQKGRESRSLRSKGRQYETRAQIEDKRAERALNLLFEIGTEEIPASYIQPALDQLRDLSAQRLKEKRVGYEKIKTFGTPRRLTLAISGLETMQPDREVEITGPPKGVAFDQDGNPTKAVTGFARSQGVDVDELKIVETPRGEYVAVSKVEKGFPTIEILQEILPDLIAEISFPKTMHWNNLRFARPIRWLTAIFGNQVVDFSLDSLRSGWITYGHRSLSPGTIELEDASIDNYLEALRKANVYADQDERREMIRGQVSEVLRLENCAMIIDEELLDTVTFLVENPQPIVGEFKESHLLLPNEVLVTSMKKHQRYFPIWKELGEVEKRGEVENINVKNKDENSLLAKFIAISNGTDGNYDGVRYGNERVLQARLEDAEFFYREDQRTSLADKVDRLKNVVFQVKLGNLYEKSCRIAEIAGYICDLEPIRKSQDVASSLSGDSDMAGSVRFARKKELYSSRASREDASRARPLWRHAATKKSAKRAAMLSKADLTTQMVIEFPSLQGIMGAYYAANFGEPDEVAQAIREHYQPISASAPCPKSLIGIVVSIADKIDTIVGYFGIGEVPTGSADPYSLRRQAIGILRTVIENKMHINLGDLIDFTFELYGGKLDENPKQQVLDFFAGRLSVNMREEYVYAFDVVDAVLSVDKTNVVDALIRARAVTAFREQPDFDQIYPAFYRVLRILPESPPTEINEELFEKDEEKRLFDLIVKAEPELDKLLVSRSYNKLIARLAKLRPMIDLFFDEVLVMAEDEAVRSNRLALLNRLAEKLFWICDFTKLVIEG